jgi:choline dehydrogenase-like flavoprotein
MRELQHEQALVQRQHATSDGRQRRFAENETVDFVIVGSGAAGGIMARELAQAGFSVVLEQGPWRTAQDFRHDEYGNWFMEAAGAARAWSPPVEESTIGAHLLGTCRMGDDPATSVVDRCHRAHDVPNLFICDGSSFVTSGRGQPTMTIMALAFRASGHISGAARGNLL